MAKTMPSHQVPRTQRAGMRLMAGCIGLRYIGKGCLSACYSLGAAPVGFAEHRVLKTSEDL